MARVTHYVCAPLKQTRCPSPRFSNKMYSETTIMFSHNFFSPFQTTYTKDVITLLSIKCMSLSLDERTREVGHLVIGRIKIEGDTLTA